MPKSVERSTVSGRPPTDPVLSDFAATIGESGPVAVEGGRTRWSTGGELDPAARVLRAPVGVVDYQPEEMIVRVRAGTTVADLDSALAEHGQRSALPRRSPDATVGGALAVGENHVSMLGRGALRTALLQVTYVSSDGVLVTGGGPTVKNVSGFDLPRLMVGSLGTLGAFVEMILRTNPTPAAAEWCTLDDVDPFAVRDALLRPSSVLWDGTRTWVEIEGHPADVAAERSALAKVGALTTVEGPPELPAHRWSLAPADARHLGRVASTHDTGRHDTGAFVAAIGTGLVFAELPQPERVPSTAVRAITDRMKEYFDPTGRLNPGRDAART